MFHPIFRMLAVTLILALLVKGNASAAPLALTTFDFEDGLIPATAIIDGNVDIVPGVTKGVIRLPCYEGSHCLRIAPGQGPRNHNAGIEFGIPDIRTGDSISFAYVVIPEINNDFIGFSLTGPGFFEWLEILPIGTWAQFSYTVPDLDEGGPSIMTTASADWMVAVWVENTVGDPDRTSLWIDKVGIERRVPEPKSILLIALGLTGIRITRKKCNK
jgi:hypothetical protein